MLKRNLQKEMVVIHKDDVALAREGIEILNEEQLKEVNIMVYSLCKASFPLIAKANSQARSECFQIL